VRAAMMIGLFALARLMRRPTTIRNLLFVSAALRLLIVPSDLFDGGFQLTYAAATGITIVGDLFASSFAPRRRIVRGVARLAGAEVTIAPITAYYFRRAMAGGVGITLLASPIVTLMLALSVALTTAAFAAQPLLRPISFLILRANDAVLMLNELVGEVLQLNLLRPRPGALFLSLVAVAVLTATLLPRRRIVIVLFVFLHLFLLLHRPTAPVEFSVEALDVGQGDSIVVRSGEHTLLVDGGGRSDDPAFGERVLLPQLIDGGVQWLDVVALTHAHPDHCGGLEAVIRSLPVGELWLSGRQWREECSTRLFAAAVERRIPVRVAEHYGGGRIGSMQLSLFTPRLRFKRSPLNNGSLVVRVVDGESSALLTGDIERDAERMLVEEAGELRSDILKVGHHGSRTSSSQLLLDAVRPRVALISCGAGNRYGHPNDEVVERLREHGTSILRTDLSGSVAIRRERNHLYRSRQFDTPRSGH
jgi:competence protein ComEC